MANYTSNTYTLKRKILTFTNKISRHLSKPDRKFTADITYGMLAAGSCLLTDVVDQLHEDSKKINIVDRLSRHLDKGVPAKAAVFYLHAIKKWVPAEPVIHIDDSDVVKPDSYKFEALGIVRDGSESTSTKNVYKKGYHVTESYVLTKNNHPVSIFSRIHSSSKKVINPQMPSLLMRSCRVLLSLEKQPLPWIVVMMTTRCFLSLMTLDRITSSALSPTASFFTITNGLLQQSFSTAVKAR